MSQDVSNYEQLAVLSGPLSLNYLPSDAWEGSAFQWIQAAPSAKKGAIGRKLFQKWARENGLSADTVTTPDNQLFVVVDGARVQVKFSTLWQEGFYKFQQIRDNDCDFFLFLGVSPFEAHAWLVPKHVIEENVIGQLGQHTGSRAQETAWVTVKPTHPPAWLKPFGDDLDTVLEMLRE